MRRKSPIIEVEPESEEEIERLKELLVEEVKTLEPVLSETEEVAEEIDRKLERLALKEAFESGAVWFTVIPEKEEKE